MTRLERHLLTTVTDILQQLNDLRVLYRQAHESGEYGIPPVPVGIHRDVVQELTDRGLVSETYRILDGILDGRGVPGELVDASTRSGADWRTAVTQPSPVLSHSSVGALATAGDEGRHRRRTV